MADMIYGYFASQIVRTFVELDIADHLAAGPQSSGEIATRTGAEPGGTARLMRAAIVYGLADLDADGRYRLTPLTDTLRSAAPRSLRGMALGATNNSHWQPWSGLPAAAKTGQCQSEAKLGMSTFDYLTDNPTEADEFTAYMESLTGLWAVDVTRVIDTTGVELAIDVGGANGALLRELQEANPALRGIVFDRPDVAAAVESMVGESTTGDRTQVVGGDFFEDLPAGDLYLLKFILHDWDDDRCVQILRRCRESMRPGARVVIIEMIVGASGDPGVAALMDLNMLVVTGGQERSVAEYDELLGRAGLQRISVWADSPPQGVIEAVAC
jgi:hypothetical protein